MTPRDRELQADREARDHLIAQAARQAIVAELRSARRDVAVGVALFVGGGGALVVSWRILTALGAVPVLLVLAGVVFGLYALVRCARGVVAWGAFSRQLREADARALPAARIVKS